MRLGMNCAAATFSTPGLLTFTAPEAVRLPPLTAGGAGDGQRRGLETLPLPMFSTPVGLTVVPAGPVTASGPRAEIERVHDFRWLSRASGSGCSTWPWGP